MQKVFCIGELLIDFFTTAQQQSLIEAMTFEKQAGGAPANVAATIAKLGGEAYFCGKVGDDAFGHFLKQTLQQMGVHTDQLIFDLTSSTTLAFVSRQADGERDFIFNRGADKLLRLEEINLPQMKQMDIIHFGSATALLRDPFCTTYEQLLQESLLQNQFISFDPNYRAILWENNAEVFVQKCQPFIQAAHFIKMSDEELLLFAQTENFDEAIRFFSKFQQKVIAITRGAAGTVLIYNGQPTSIPSVVVNAIDTTGAGDAFVGAVLYQLAALPENMISFNEWVSIIEFANRVGAKVCEKVGAIESLPTLEQLQ
ncbi:carbohydrate kinase [Lysinibacillus sp. 2017]|uniref:carbohydrate kinase family protein n=1 Tax=unclassified Lysinibacillus TaxID=2636778 RepID=UPI000D526343|nr:MULTISPECIES: carbohydrate kinase [unclassified Lysinibacillus]AWE06103.1 carbohydrate kinase [Lysinibacillus sp. 2017]TGN33380.1 carbohydrate kinase [Lysinibacillus sp. S2017]